MAEQLPDFDHFDHDDASRVGSALVARCRVEGLAVTISICRAVTFPFTADSRSCRRPQARRAIRRPGSSHLDGPEYSPDGAWLYLNTEEFASHAGHAQLARVPFEGGPMERIVESESVGWFPHLSPDGEFATYISFPPGTVGHPPDLDVQMRLVRNADWCHVVSSFPLFGGQGTLNVNSWSPDVIGLRSWRIRCSKNEESDDRARL
jgi:hypothetical protein